MMEAVKEKVELQRYPEYKDSEVEYLGKIPADWGTAYLGSIIEPKSDKGHPNYEVLSVYRDYGVIPKDSRDDNHNATALDTSNYKAVHPGDLVVNKMKAWQGSMGISDYKGIVSPAYITCKVRDGKFDRKFLHYLLRSQSYIGEYNRLSYGVRIGQWDMHYEDFKKVTVVIPSPKEQTAIAQFLDRKTEQIDQVISSRRKTLNSIFELICTHVLMGENINKDQKAIKTWEDIFPDEWEMEKAKRIFKESNIRNNIGKELLAVTQDEGIIFKSDSSKNYVSPSGDLSGLKLVKKDDYVISLRSFEGGIETSEKEGIVSPAYNVFYLKEDLKCIELQKYYQYLFKTPQFIKLLNTLVTSIRDGKNISFNDFSEVPLPRPKPAQVRFLLKYFDIYEKAKKHFSEAEKYLTEYKTTLINSAVTGKIKVI